MKIELYNSDNLEIMAKMLDESVDVICIDPPYLYLKNQKLECEFNEQLFFSECKRLLTNDGFIIMFGRGESFYRWNTILADMKFTFKEEIIWNKRRTSSPFSAIGRIHETISIFSKGRGKINNVKVCYGELKAFDQDKVYEDIKRLQGLFSRGKSYEKVIENLRKADKLIDFSHAEKESKFKVTSQTFKKKCVSTHTLLVIENGMREQTIISDNNNHYSNIHPTQKPVRLLERLLKLVIPMKKDKIVVADWFAGSFSCCEAVINLQAEFPEKAFEFIGTEIDEEYFESGKNRINNIKKCTP